MRRLSLTIIVMMSLLLSVSALSVDCKFTDIENSEFVYAISGLFEQGVVENGYEFFPQEALSKDDAAKWLVKAFYLAEIDPMYIEEDVEKKFEYSNGLGVIDESFTVPSFQDTQGNENERYIEGLSAARIIAPEATFSPESGISGVDFSTMIGKIVFGVDCENPLERLEQQLVAYPVDLLYTEENLTREQAAAILFGVIGDSRFKTVTTLITSDIHGHIEPYKPQGANYFIGGMAKMVEYVKSMRERQSNLLMLDIGDAPYNTNVANLFEGEPVINIMNLMGYDAMVLGNHDFDFPFNVMERNAGLANFPFLSANTYHDAGYPEFLSPYVFVEVNDLVFAIVGLTDDSSAWYTHPKNVEGIVFMDHFDAAERYVNEVRDYADVVIGLVHCHGDNEKIAEQVEGFDFVLGGGNDIVAFPKKKGESYLVSAGKHAEMIGQLNLNFWNDELVGFNFSNVFMSENLKEDPFAKILSDKYVSAMDEKLNTVVAKTEVDLDGERSTVRLKESNLANIIADSLIALTGADVAIQNGGGVRASIEKGEITIKDIYTVLPFDNTVVVVEATGKTIWETLEHGVSWYPSAGGGFLQVAGMEYTFDASKEPGERIVSVTIDGEPIKMDKVYTLAANDFLTGGGDKFTMLAECKEVLRTKHFLRDSFKEYIQELEVIAPVVEGRITILNEAE
jgi:2',3'-cyclic-nucleotide 2'-phosphodiesterase (5'-nucleotidase family)